MSSTPIAGEYISIGELAKEFGATLRALRYYENHGLLKPLRHRQQRLYTNNDRKILDNILKAQKFGFTLREIQALIHTDLNSFQANDLQLSREQIIEQLELLNRRKKEIESGLAELRKTVAKLEAPSEQAG